MPLCKVTDLASETHFAFLNGGSPVVIVFRAEGPLGGRVRHFERAMLHERVRRELDGVAVEADQFARLGICPSSLALTRSASRGL
jgi:hypothetical protein